MELEEEYLKRQHIQGALENLKQQFYIEEGEAFRDGYNLARRIIKIHEEGTDIY